MPADVTEFAGLVDRASGLKVPLQGVSVRSVVDDVLATHTITQRFVNPRADPLEVIYTFPVEEGATVSGLEVVIGDKRLRGIVKKRKEAREDYDDAIAAGGGGFLVEQDEKAPDVFTATLGNIPPGREVELVLTVAVELASDGDALRLTIPTSVAPRYAPDRILKPSLPPVPNPGPIIVGPGPGPVPEPVLPIGPIVDDFDGPDMPVVAMAAGGFARGLAHAEAAAIHAEADEPPRSPGVSPACIEEPAISPVIPPEPSPAVPPEPIPEFPATATPSYPLEIRVEVHAPDALSRLVCPSHADEVVVDFAGSDGTVVFRVGESSGLGGDFVVLIEHAKTREARLWVSQAWDATEAAVAAPGASAAPASAADTSGLALLVTSYPQLDAGMFTEDAKAEFVFVVDRSGSMAGSKMRGTIEALKLCLRAITPGSFFNIVSFGNAHSMLFGGGSREYTADTLTQALAHVDAMKADMGGTEILQPLRSVFGTPARPTHPRQVLLLTDGEVANTDEVIDLVREFRAHSSVRVFAFGIGREASTALVRGVAEAGGGAAEFILPGESVEDKVARQMDRALQPVLRDVHVEWGALTPLVRFSAPKKLRALYDGDRVTVFALLGGGVWDEATAPATATVKLVAEGPDGRIEWPMEVDVRRAVAASRGEGGAAGGGAASGGAGGSDGTVETHLCKGRAVWTLGARAVIADLVAEEGATRSAEERARLKSSIEAISIRFRVSSKYTSFVAIEVRENAVTGPMKTELVGPATGSADAVADASASGGGIPVVEPEPVEVPEPIEEPEPIDEPDPFVDDVEEDDGFVGRRGGQRRHPVRDRRFLQRGPGPLPPVAIVARVHAQAARFDDGIAAPAAFADAEFATATAASAPSGGFLSSISNFFGFSAAPPPPAPTGAEAPAFAAMPAAESAGAARRRHSGGRRMLARAEAEPADPRPAARGDKDAAKAKKGSGTWSLFGSASSSSAVPAASPAMAREQEVRELGASTPSSDNDSNDSNDEGAADGGEDVDEEVETRAAEFEDRPRADSRGGAGVDDLLGLDDGGGAGAGAVGGRGGGGGGGGGGGFTSDAMTDEELALFLAQTMGDASASTPAPALAPAPAPAPAAPVDDERRLAALTARVSFEGRVELDEALAALVGVSLADLRSARPASSVAGALGDALWATALVLATMAVKFAPLEVRWTAIARKCERWVRKQGLSKEAADALLAEARAFVAAH